MTCENCAIVLSKAGFAKEAEYLKKEAKETYETYEDRKKRFQVSNCQNATMRLTGKRC